MAHFVPNFVAMETRVHVPCSNTGQGSQCCPIGLGVSLLMLHFRSSYWVLLVHGALFCIIWHNPQSHLRKGFLYRPAGGRAPIRHSTTSAGYCIGVVA